MTQPRDIKPITSTLTLAAICKQLPVLSPWLAILAGICLVASDAEVLAALMLGGGLVGVGVLLGQKRDRWRSLSERESRIWMRRQHEPES